MRYCLAETEVVVREVIYPSEAGIQTIEVPVIRSDNNTREVIYVSEAGIQTIEIPVIRSDNKDYSVLERHVR